MEPIEQKLQTLQTELKGYFDKAAEEKKQYGSMLETTKTAVEALQKQVDAIDVRLAEKHAGGTGEPSLDEIFQADDGVQNLLRKKRGQAVLQLKGNLAARLMERKTTITSAAVGAMTSGVLQIDRTPGITTEARQVLKVRDLLSARPTQMQVVDFVKVDTPMAIASPQVEASAKAENAATFTTKSETVKTVATWIPASKQILDDFQELMGFINTMLPYYVNLEEEIQLLSGSGVGPDLDGLITQATAFLTSQLSNVHGWNKIDVIGRTIQQITAAKELQPTFVIMHPNDWWDIRLTKDAHGQYILGNPQADVRPNIFGLDVAPTTSIASGSFLVGSGSPIASEIRDRMEMQVEISTEYSDYFVKNLVAIRAEKRLCLVVKRPGSYIAGTFTTSP